MSVMEVSEKVIELKKVYIKFINYCVENDIKRIVMFIKDEKNILKINRYLKEQSIDIQLIGVTFPANEKMYELDENDKLKEFIPRAAKGNMIKEVLKEYSIPLISGSLPFEGIVIPGDKHNPYKIIEKTFSIVNRALPNLVQTLLIATDSGAVLPGERILIANAELAIDANGTNARLLFHPKEGLQINEIIKS